MVSLRVSDTKRLEVFFRSLDVHGLTSLVTCEKGILRTRDGKLPHITFAYAPSRSRTDVFPLQILYLENMTRIQEAELRRVLEEDIAMELIAFDASDMPNAFNICKPNLTRNFLAHKQYANNIDYLLSLYRIEQ